MQKIISKFFISLSVCLALVAIFMSFFATPVSAANLFEGRGTNNNTESCFNFLGLTSWDCGLVIDDISNIKGGIWQIVANVAIDITVIAAYLVLGFVIYGGYLFMFSRGDPNKVATGSKTLIQAFIGLAVVMSAYIIMNAIRIALLGGGSAAFNCDPVSGGDECMSGDGASLIVSALTWIYSITGIIAAVFVVFGGISYITANGDPSKLQKAKNTILYALIGLIIVALAEIITSFVAGKINDAKTNPSSSAILITNPKKELYEKNY